MAHLTGNFLAETPLSPKARQALNDALDQGWHDHKKLSQHSARARILHDSALESLAASLRVRPSELEPVGEPALVPYLAIAGLLETSERLIYSAVDRKEVFAIARGQASVLELPVDRGGQILLDSLARDTEGVLSLQGANGETGVIQNVELLAAHSPGTRLACDYSVVGPRLPLPARWESAFFDAKSWQGPQGVGLLAIREGAAWSNPLPHLSNLRSPQSVSLPLMIAAAVALEEWIAADKNEAERLRTLTEEIRSEIATTLENCDIAGDLDRSLPHITSLSFLYVQGEELLRALEKKGFRVDSGSACTAEDLKPSHILAAMGLLTHGNIRITLHHGVASAEVRELISAIKLAVTQLRQP